AAGEESADSIGKVLAIIAPADDKHLESWQLSALSPLLDALERKNLTLEAIAGGNREVQDVVKRVDLLFGWASKLAAEPDTRGPLREAAVRLLGRRPQVTSDLELVVSLLGSPVSARLQSAALDA